MNKCGVCILGATGSIGQSTLDVIRQHPNTFEVIALSAFQDAETLLAQCIEFKPQFAVLVQTQKALWLQSELKAASLKTQLLTGADPLNELVQLPEVHKVVAAIVGAAGLPSTMAAVNAGKQILIANKEALVMAGDLLLASARRSGATLLPIDSEHNALFQCMPPNYRLGTRPNSVKRLIITASGGPFLQHSDLTDITPEMACQHPTWKMGKKITVDSATLMNKGLEVIEACHLFQMSPQEIEVVIHPQSIVHSLVEYIDGSLLAQLGAPDMRTPIAYCLSWPERLSLKNKAFSLTEMGQLTFLPPDTHKFPCLSLAYEAIHLAGAAPTVLNASNEIAVQAFLNKTIPFLAIPPLIKKTLEKYADLSVATLDDILQADQLARNYTQGLINNDSFSTLNGFGVVGLMWT